MPNPIEASEASRTPGSSRGWVGGPALSPSAGLWPPLPGRRAMAMAIGTEATARTGNGHQVGTGDRSSPLGRSL